MKLQEQVNRIKQMMGIIKEQDDTFIMQRDNTNVSNPRIDYLVKDLPKSDDTEDKEEESSETSKDEKETSIENKKLLSSLTKKGRGVEGHTNQVRGTGMDNWESRNAYDLMCEPGTTVHTPVDGKITALMISKSANPYVYGMSIKITTTDGKDQIFMTHLDPEQQKVTKGQEVKKGDIVGVIGDPAAAGKKFASHLHVSTKDENHTIYKYVSDDLTIV